MILIIIITNFLIGFVHVISCVPEISGSVQVCSLRRIPSGTVGHLLEFQDLVFGEVELLSPVGKFSTAQSHVKVIGEKVIPFLWFYLIYIYIVTYLKPPTRTYQNWFLSKLFSSCQTGSQAPGANFGEFGAWRAPWHSTQVHPLSKALASTTWRVPKWDWDGTGTGPNTESLAVDFNGCFIPNKYNIYIYIYLFIYLFIFYLCYIILY